MHLTYNYYVVHNDFTVPPRSNVHKRVCKHDNTKFSSIYLHSKTLSAIFCCWHFINLASAFQLIKLTSLMHWKDNLFHKCLEFWTITRVIKVSLKCHSILQFYWRNCFHLKKNNAIAKLNNTTFKLRNLQIKLFH